MRPIFFEGGDEFARYANDMLKGHGGGDQQNWFRLMAIAQRATGVKPSQKILLEAKAVIGELGADRFKKDVLDWFTYILRLEDPIGGREFISAPNQDILKGFIWFCSQFHDANTLLTLSKLAERCHQKQPGGVAVATALGNACFYSLAHSKGLDGIGHLSRLKLRIKQNSTQTLIEKYLREAAGKEGVSVHEIEDMAVEDFGLKEGQREYEFDGYKALLEIIGVGRTAVRWFKPDGTPQKAVPTAVKEGHAAKLKKLKDTAKQIELTLTAQRDRLDRTFRAAHTMEWEKFNELYLSHGLMSWLTKRLIWSIEQEGRAETLFFHKGNGIDAALQPVTVAANARVSLWHPVNSEVPEITAWRNFFLDNGIVQPMKQAFREIYLLTDSEINTRTYSNRMAAHILKQHQFNSLAKNRGWKYSLLGAFDNGRHNSAAELLIPDHRLRAEYWINEVNADNATSDSGIWLYIVTDQVRFLDTNTNQVVQLIDIPPIVLSEVLRDVDLFVGVASVGNDPDWRDNGGLPAYRNYWEGYSFGELTEVAKTRKLILQRLLPRLKIAGVAEITDRFLVVKGKLRTYKIHLGSTNILMEPNDQYLCIVPDRSAAGDVGSHGVFLPFEGDSGLSLILSKAFLLAADDKITDTTITRQIKR